MKKFILILLVCLGVQSLSNTEHFDIIVNKLFEFEGATLVKAEDGYSKFGLTKYYTKDIKGLTKSKAKSIIYKDVYLKHNLDKIDNLAIKHFVFDFLYNTNPYKAIKIIKRICKNYDEEIDITNYTLSDRVIKVLNENPELFDELIQARLSYIRNLKLYKKYGNGWENRINWFRINYRRYTNRYYIQVKAQEIINKFKKGVLSSMEQI